MDWKKPIGDFFKSTAYDSAERDKVNAYKAQYIPRRLFKYRSFSGHALDNFRNGTLWCTTASNFNDPYDSALSFDAYSDEMIAEAAARSLGVYSDAEVVEILASDNCISEVFSRVVQKYPDLNAELVEKVVINLRTVQRDHRVKMIDLVNDGLQSTTKICSLCERIDSVVMWSHYAQNHTGFAIEYDFSVLPPSDFLVRSLWPVIYDNKLYDATGHLGLALKKDEPASLFLIGAALHKAQDWSYEAEWRLVIPESQDDPPRSFKAPAPSAVYIGSRMSDKNVESVLSISRHLDVPVYQMQLSRFEFSMEAVLRG
ncbi:TPA: DUF2971 domain-containing protein [Pseudomonas aeruginosa]|uniref:DUF2971 domain-containing protein n=1 Tax=Pseudomonas aeruginosa TaxID=287 RepID=UPI00135FC6CD|nr:DUF2971 domain-containing protein [Pseudomonas aeruginosa]MBG7505887.1 DUF2971 domain-containing protein [Pseudomonas aeruginosa]MWW04605.1 DUF2971 domain-containing protein [Pseudomonas aeruginosa]HCF2637070.1 DUF2971 domain-containing protein [Pseudomonas aeruginosa]HEJ1656673.1 DUF2971 domain-containing protein [Pseudomonas aeruginosa]HEJ3084950.1 DUF2971 domain-containing protein [Pseudomonas aeruginosa]